MRILDKGELVLRDFMGSDIAVVEAARVSNDVTENVSRGDERDGKLIAYLMKHRHFTPFEHSVFKFYVKCPIFVAREWMRHRAASYNEVSGRYVKFEPEFYIPDRMRVPAKSNKQGSVFLDPPDPHADAALRMDMSMASNAAFVKYDQFVAAGLAREVARMILPLNLYTKFYWTVNCRNLLHFIELRNAPDAQWEIRQYAAAAEKIVAEKMPLTYDAFVKYGERMTENKS